MGDDRYFLDPATGERMTIEEAEKHPNPLKSRLWAMRHPILYLPHELSPLLRVLNDRVVSVTCLGTKGPSYRHDFFPNPDFETALMRTEKDAVLRLSASFTLPNIRRRQMGYHWHRVIGTKGCVETHRSDADQMKWLHDLETGQPEEIWWDHDAEKVAPEILATGHDGTDYYPLRKFVDSVLEDKPSEMDVYCAAESAAPAILAAQSAERNGMMLEVPNFRRSPGEIRT
jgi:predicted dehydrogenase